MPVPTNLDDMIIAVLKRLDDLEGRTEETATWSREEIAIYVKDGYDEICRRTKCLFDMAYVENVPAMGNYSSDEELELMQQIPGMLITGKRNFTRELDKQLVPPGSVGPASISSHADIPLMGALHLETGNPTGQLPREFVEVQQVLHDQLMLEPEYTSVLAREIDNRYESMGGRTTRFTIDKDGMFTLRRYPSGDGQAVFQPVAHNNFQLGFYPDVAFWGAESLDIEFVNHGGVTYGDSYYVDPLDLGSTDVTNLFGTLTHDPATFPIGGPWGAPTRLEPDVDNTRVEITRLGRDLDSYPFELPRNYLKFVKFWACARALKRDGEGQDLKLSQHYFDRVEMGVSRLHRRVEDVQQERAGRLGYPAAQGTIPPLNIGLPYNYGQRIRRSRRY